MVKDFTYLGSTLSADGETARVKLIIRLPGCLRPLAFSGCRFLPKVLFLLVLRELFTMR